MADYLQNIKRTRSGTIWIIAGCLIILLPIFIFSTSDNIKRQKQGLIRLLTEKGEALIRSFEAGTRVGMQGSFGEQFKLQGLLYATAQQPDISYIMITDLNGVIRNDSKRDEIGETYAKDINLHQVAKTDELRWREITDKNGKHIFEVYRLFTPRLMPRILHHWRMRPSVRDPRYLIPKDPNEEKQIIFVGLDMTHVDALGKQEEQQAIKKGIYLLFLGLGGISLLFLFQAYRSTKSSLTRIKAFSNNIVENMPIGLIALDTDSRIASVNHTAEMLLHLLEKDIVGKSIDAFLPEQIVNLLKELKENRKNIEREIDIKLDEEDTTTLDISMSTLEDNDGLFLGYIMLFRDLTEMQALKREIERSSRLASIGRLAAGVAHEIRNPLSSIKGFATYFAERYKDIQEDRDTAEIMVKEVERLNRVISQLLEFARPVSIKRDKISISTIINHSIKMIERNALSKNIRIKRDIPSDIPKITADSDRLNQVFLNLFLNSIEAMDESGELSVAARYEPETERITLSVTDTGKGIAPQYLASVFDPYFTTKQSGTGLGLAIVLRIIESHNGEISIESEPGKGSKVTIHLPIN